jgi:hypothetical protein
MKSLAELKRTIKPGLRLRCIENTYRPELNGKIRTVCRVQTNAFTWKTEEAHEIKINSLRDADAVCSCGGWSVKFPTFDHSTETNESIRANIEREFAGHLHRAGRESWTNYEKAPAYTFVGNRFTFGIALAGKEHHVTLEVLPCA